MTAPDRFTQQTLDWQPWLEPMSETELTERHYQGLVQRPRAKNPYFRLPSTWWVRARSSRGRTGSC